MLADSDPRLRELILVRLSTVERQNLITIAPGIRAMVQDASSRVRQAATRLVHQIDSIGLAPEGE